MFVSFCGHALRTHHLMTTRHVQVSSGLALLMIGLVLIYAQAVRSPAWPDDLPQLGHVSHFDSVVDCVGRDCYGLSRPVKNLLFLAFSKWAPGTPWAWHLVSLMLFCATVFSVGRYSWLFLREGIWSLFVAAIWALAPTQMATVAWLSGINIVVMTLCIVSCLLANERAQATGDILYRISAPFLFLIAALDKAALRPQDPVPIVFKAHISELMGHALPAEFRPKLESTQATEQKP